MNDKMKLLGWMLVGALLVLVASFAGGCSAQPGLRVASKFGTEYADQFNVTGHKDAGTPATAESSGSKASVPLPSGSRVTFTPAKGVDAGSVSVELSAPSAFTLESRGTKASTGTIDTETAQHRIDVEQAAEDRRPLLWVAIACGVAGILARALVKEWPAIGNGLLGAAALAAVAWKVSEVPWWAFAAFLAVVAVGIAFYKRAEWDANGNGVPDALERGRK